MFVVSASMSGSASTFGHGGHGAWPAWSISQLQEWIAAWRTMTAASDGVQMKGIVHGSRGKVIGRDNPVARPIYRVERVEPLFGSEVSSATRRPLLHQRPVEDQTPLQASLGTSLVRVVAKSDRGDFRSLPARPSSCPDPTQLRRRFPHLHNKTPLSRALLPELKKARHTGIRKGAQYGSAISSNIGCRAVPIVPSLFERCQRSNSLVAY